MSARYRPRAPWPVVGHMNAGCILDHRSAMPRVWLEEAMWFKEPAPVVCAVYGKAKILALAVATLAGLSIQPAAQRADATDVEKQAIEEMFVSYNRALIEKNYRLLGEQLAVPFVVVDTTTRLVDDLNVVVEGLRKVREAMEQQGYATSTLGPARFIRLAEDRVLVDRTVHHLKHDGSLLVERANVYIVRRSSGRWRVAGTMQQDPKSAGKVD